MDPTEDREQNLARADKDETGTSNNELEGDADSFVSLHDQLDDDDDDDEKRPDQLEEEARPTSVEEEDGGRGEILEGRDRTITAQGSLTDEVERVIELKGEDAGLVDPCTFVSGTPASDSSLRFDGSSRASVHS